MVARIVDFRTRTDLQMRLPRSVSYNIDPSQGGAAGHWGGPRQNIGSHVRCEQIWRSWQNYHMDSHGWVDIAYNGAYCNHGIALAGRGHGVRSAANGTNLGNSRYHAYVWIGGQGERPSREALDALEWWILQGRKAGAGRRCVPHRIFTGTTCPGNDITRHLATLDNQNISGETIKPVTQVTEFDRWWNSVDDDLKEVLVEFAKRVKARGGSNPGRSIANQFYIFHDKERPMLKEFNRLMGVKSAGGALGTSAQGATLAGLNAFLYLNDQGAGLHTRSRYDA